MSCKVKYYREIVSGNDNIYIYKDQVICKDKIYKGKVSCKDKYYRGTVSCKDKI